MFGSFSFNFVTLLPLRLPVSGGDGVQYGLTSVYFVWSCCLLCAPLPVFEATAGAKDGLCTYVCAYCNRRAY